MIFCGLFWFPETYDVDALVSKEPDVKLAVSSESIQELGNVLKNIKRFLYPDGALNVKPVEKGVWILPYMANLTCIGLMRAAYVLNDQETFEIVKKWLKWYASHVQPDGAVHDYAGGSYPNYFDTGDYDSLDSYWATFSYDLWLYAVLTKDIEFVRSLYPAFEKNTKAFLGVWNADGLTIAKPHYPVKYSMDNSEVFLGLIAAAKLEKLLGHPEKSEKFVRMAKRNVSGIVEKLWIPYTYCFTCGLTEDTGLLINRDVHFWYPDGLAQVLVASFVLKPSEENAKWFKSVFELSVERAGSLAEYPYDVFHLAWMAIVAWKFSLKSVEERSYRAFLEQAATSPRGDLLPTYGWWLIYLTKEFFGKDLWF